LADRPIDIYNGGDMLRDFTYVDDLVKSVDLLLHRPPTREPAAETDSLSRAAPFRVVNIGGGAPHSLMDFITEIEVALGRTAKRNLMPMQPGDVKATFADATLLEELTGYRPDTPPRVGIAAFCRWYLEHYHGA
jgi:UDP-glucuronate 4-epimerase